MVMGLHLFFPAAARLGWLTTAVPNPPSAAARGTAFLFRGQGAVFSRSFGTVCDRLREAGVWAEDCRCVGDRWACGRLLDGGETDPLPGPVVLVGHSRGGRRAAAAAARLGAGGVRVELLICIDVAFSPPVPANVRTAVHLFRSRRRLYPARPLTRVTGSNTAIENVDLDRPGAPFPGRGLHHLNITRAERVRDWVVARVVRETIGR